MNTDICFQISAPASLSIFGEHTKNELRACIDLRTTLIFQEIPVSLPNDINYINIHFPRINLSHKIPLQRFLNFYNDCAENMELSHEKVLQFILQFEPLNQDQKIILQIFYYLFVHIKYKEEIEIKPFIILLSTLFTSNRELMTSSKICLAACLLHWSCLQKGVHNTFDKTDLEKIFVYATCCEIVSLKSDLFDIMVCTYGSIIKCDREHNKYERLRLPSMAILLVDSNQTQEKVQIQRVTELTNMFPELVNCILNNIYTVTNLAYDAFKEIFYIYENNELSIEMKNICLLQQQKALEIYSRKNHRLLEMLGIPNIQLDVIRAIMQKHGLSIKYTNCDNGRYAYIWYPHSNVTDITIIIEELETHGFKVTLTNLFCTAVKIE